jgi:alcohol dehydrogenase
MNFFHRMYCRSYQKIVYWISFSLNWSEPELHEGAGSLKDIPFILNQKNRIHPLIVTDPGIYKLGLQSPLIQVLGEQKIAYELYHDVIPNPTFDVVEEAYKMYRDGNCDCLIALGGGSSMDTAKAVGARSVNPHKTLSQLKGILKVGHKLPLLIAIPTTAGTGSEATLAAVVVNPKTKDKFSINDPHLIPGVAVLDNTLLQGLASRDHRFDRSRCPNPRDRKLSRPQLYQENEGLRLESDGPHQRQSLSLLSRC